MHKELLQRKIIQLLNVGEEEKEVVFSLLKEKIANYLKVGEAVKIPELGVFQLKEKFTKPESVQNNEQDTKDLTLVFSPETNEGVQESLFINLEVEQKIKDETEFDEGVFQLGVAKPLATSIDENNEDSEISQLEKSIDNLLEKSEKLQNYDLWDDYLKAKESTSILESNDNNTNEEDDNDVVEENIIEESVEEKDFIPLEEDEVFDDLMEENEFVQDDELDNLTDEIEVKESILDSTSENIVDNILDDEDTIEIDLEKIKKNLEVDEIKDDFEDLIDSNIEEDKDNLIDEQLDDDFDEIIKEQIEKIKDDEIENDDDSQVAEEVKRLHTEFPPPIKEDVKYHVSAKRKSPIIYVLIAMFIIVGAIGIYYLFFRNPAWLYDEYEYEVALSEKYLHEYENMKKHNYNDSTMAMANDSQKVKVDKELNEEAKKSVVKNDVQVDENVISDDDKEVKELKKKKIDKIIADIEKKKAVAKSTMKEKQKIGEKKVFESNVTGKTKNDKTNKEREVGQNIFYDGYVYNIQLSSWPKKETAERQVNKYIKKGYSAFLVKAYIPKFKSNWFRVRIGPFTTLKEARSVQKKIK